MNKISTLKKIFYYIKKYPVSVFLSLLFALIAVILTLYIPIIIGRATDCIIGKGKVDFDAITALLAKVAIIASATAVLQWVMNVLNNRIVFNVTKDLRHDAFQKAIKLPIKYIDSHAHGEIVNRITSDVEQIADGLLLGFSQGFSGIVTIIATIFFMVSVNYKIAFAVILITPLSFFCAKFIASHTYEMFSKRSKLQAEQTAFINEMIGNQKTVKAFSYEKKATEEFDKINERLEKAALSAIFFSSLTNPATRFINSVIYAVVGLFGALSAISGNLTVGGLVCFLSYANQYTKPFNEISGVISEMQNALACAARVFELTGEKEEIPDSPNGLELNAVRGDVKLDNVYFSYSDDKKLIENLNLNIKQGLHVAIVGPTGCGKTTLINLLMRFYDVDRGIISVDGQNIKAIKRKSLRKSYGMVLQDTWLKSGTVKENIAMGKEDATDDEIILAAKAAHADSFIKRLPKGYDTYITEEGGNISEGQKQLLCIARIMLCLPPMLILDEATSSIDTKTEQKIQKAFDSLTVGKTSFIVAHRLSTIMGADVILVMRDGKIIEQGTHKELLSKQGFYSHLYNSQFEE